MAAIMMEEVAEQYRKALRGEVAIRLADPEWGSFCGNVDFWFGDWRVTFFNDCDELDYTDSVTTLDGRRAEFDDWCDGYFIGCPLDLLNEDEYAALEQMVRSRIKKPKMWS
jgi:hypothetical protein